MRQIWIAEDETAERERLQQYLQDYAKDRAQEIMCRAFSNGKELVEQYHAGVDLILLDIDMEQMDGITAARRIRPLDEQVQIVFITRMAAHALEGYEVQAADYIIKPLSYELFCMKMDRIFRKMQQDTDERIEVKAGSEQHYLTVREIRCVETSGKHNIIWIGGTDGKETMLETGMPLYQMEKQLGNSSFFRCHNAFLVNLRFVTGYSPTDVFVGDRKIPLSKHRRKAFVEALTAYIARRM